MKKKSYVLIYSDDLGTREEVRDFLDAQSKILNWRWELPNAFFLVSELSAHELAALVHRLNEKARFLITEYAAVNSEGWLGNNAWKILNEQALPGETQDKKAT